jgi:uncharacterized protein YndB with AHSA1/START domain
MSPDSAPAPAVVTTPTDREIRIERSFHAPRSKVWRAMTEPELLARWWGRGNPLDVPVHEFRRGGHYRFVEHSDHGEDGFEGRFGDIEAPATMVQTFEWDGMPAHPARLSISLEDRGDTTHMVESMVFFTAEERDGMLASGMEGGMSEALEALDRLLATLE